MEFRKLISFGKSSYVISLPKAWVTKNRLNKGDLIEVEEDGPKLILSKQIGESQEEEKELTIMVDGKSRDWITREVCTAYITNYRTIKLKGKELKTKVKMLQDVIQNMMALEIMEQTTDSIVAKDFLNMDKVSPTELLRKIDIVTRTMIQETTLILDEDNYDSINQRDKDVNKLYFLVYRSVLYNMENPTKALKNLGVGPRDLMRIQNIGFYLEDIADEIRRVARHARKAKFKNKAIKDDLRDILKDLQNYYLDSIKSIHSTNVTKALKNAELKKPLDKKLDEFEIHMNNDVSLSKVVHAIRRIFGSIHNMGRSTYTLTTFDKV